MRTQVLRGVLAGLLLLSAHCQAQQSGGADEIVATIGYAGPLKEHLAGKSASAAQLAVEEANREGLRVGGRKVVFSLLLQDDKANPRTAEFVAKYLGQSEVIAVVGHWTSANSISAAPIYDRAGVAQVTPFAWSKLFTAPGYRGAFQMVGNDENGLAATTNYLVKTMKMTSFYVIDDGGLLGSSLGDTFIARVTALGAQVLGRQRVSPNTSDFNAALMAARSLNPDVIFFSGRPVQSDVVARSMVRLRLSSKLFLTGSITSDDFLTKAGDVQDMLLAIKTRMPAANSQPLQQLQARYQARFGEPMEPLSIYAYDSVKVIIEAVRKSGSLERGKIIDALHATHYNGVSGPIAFGADGTLLKPTYSLYQSRQQKWVLLHDFK
ncbi:branched-chain amino acid ABC transporter substrate-binding protein [Herbaspirillum sp. LeCh32-8]|uniref:branched-chain amino acid ABC transporter substrate-binding protein n=1 Tax=Herbaspirillum sp. LeCh32-8 TaxID=2821356 RepID=UPI001AE874CD|nr:branched-chain amino acid ABC transporter substrate-binding protein [Herbaspirillum sp. LeCh32-8]MBP0598431.1 branched-chain amino acid ABC transporter substrate-binding protein [Herbaspirillum sp. LeCh32-8]